MIMFRAAAVTARTEYTRKTTRKHAYQAMKPRPGHVYFIDIHSVVEHQINLNYEYVRGKGKSKVI